MERKTSRMFRDQEGHRSEGTALASPWEKKKEGEKKNQLMRRKCLEGTPKKDGSPRQSVVTREKKRKEGKGNFSGPVELAGRRKRREERREGEVGMEKKKEGSSNPWGKRNQPRKQKAKRKKTSAKLLWTGRKGKKEKRFFAGKASLEKIREQKKRERT